MLAFTVCLKCFKVDFTDRRQQIQWCLLHLDLLHLVLLSPENLWPVNDATHAVRCFLPKDPLNTPQFDRSVCLLNF